MTPRCSIGITCRNPNGRCPLAGILAFLRHIGSRPLELQQEILSYIDVLQDEEFESATGLVALGLALFGDQVHDHASHPMAGTSSAQPPMARTSSSQPPIAGTSSSHHPMTTHPNISAQTDQDGTYDDDDMYDEGDAEPDNSEPDNAEGNL
jgi:hypothetical protein